MYALTAFKAELKRILSERGFELPTLDEAMAMAEDSEVVKLGVKLDNLSHYICDNDTYTLEEIYYMLLESPPDALADDIVTMWPPFDQYTVMELLLSI